MKPSERFWSKVDVGEKNECWIWQGKKSDGYGRFYLQGRRVYAHRYAWELANEMKIPDGLLVLHSCDEPSCVNPAHLHLGTQAQNMREMKEKGRSTYGERNGMAVLDEPSVKMIRNLHQQGKLSAKEIAQVAGVSYSQVKKIIRGERWTHVPD